MSKTSRRPLSPGRPERIPGRVSPRHVALVYTKKVRRCTVVAWQVICHLHKWNLDEHKDRSYMLKRKCRSLLARQCNVTCQYPLQKRQQMVPWIVCSVGSSCESMPRQWITVRIWP